MKVLNLILALMLVLGSVTAVKAQDTLYAEYFTDGQIMLDWFTPWDGGDEMAVDYWEGNPSGDSWVGLIENGLSGGGVGTAMSGELNMTDYRVESYIYTTVNTGSYNGIVARWDTTGGINNYYSLRADFDSNQRLQLRWYPGPTGFGESIREWVGGEIPGGVPTADEWHKLALKIEGNQLWAYYDDTELAGSPFTDNNCMRGFFGVYLFNMLATTETYCDDIIVTGDAGAQPFDFIALDNTMLNSALEPMIYRAAEGETVYFQLDWDAINGSATSPAFRIVMELDDTPIFTENNPGVEPNTSHTLNSNAWTATLGEHTVRWTIDALNSVAEGNEDNNVIEEMFLVLPVDAYDFATDSTWVTNEDTVVVDEVFENNDHLFVLHWSVPMGSGSVSAFDVRLDVDGAQEYLVTIPFVQSGATYTTVSDPWTAIGLGPHYFEWFIDPANLVDEFAEWNNSTLDGFEVVIEPGIPDPWQLSNQATTFQISSVYPNPFNPSVTLQYETLQPGNVSLIVYDVAGREIAVLADKFHQSGLWEVTWSGEEMAAGTYFAVLESNGKRDVQPLLLVK
ncbi:MAG: CARDB domain-containing protein [bacterium]